MRRERGRRKSVSLALVGLRGFPTLEQRTSPGKYDAMVKLLDPNLVQSANVILVSGNAGGGSTPSSSPAWGCEVLIQLPWARVAPQDNLTCLSTLHLWQLVVEASEGCADLAEAVHSILSRRITI